MKKFISSLFLILCFTLSCFSQEKKETPSQQSEEVSTQQAKIYLEVSKIKLSVNHSEINEKEEIVEKALPLNNTEAVRKVKIVDIDGTTYVNAKIYMTTVSFVDGTNAVKVSIFDINNKRVWKKTLSGAYLYVFSDGQIQIGQRNFQQVLIYRERDTNSFIGLIRAEEGIY